MASIRRHPAQRVRSEALRTFEYREPAGSSVAREADIGYEAARFWLPEGQEIPVFDAGFMPDPAGFWSGAVPDGRPLAGLSDIACLILIGEPGLGKSTALRAEYERIQVELGNEDRAHFVELGCTRQAETLREEIFGSPEYTGWLAGEGRLHLFLDSLDEARLRIEHAARLLLQGLDGAPHGRLVLRLSCRSADRQHEFEQELRQRFEPDNFAVRELAPLRRVDIVAAASARGLDGEAIVGEVIVRELQPLAMVPEALNFLLDVAEESGTVPASRREAFEQGLALLSREPDEERRDEQAGGKLSAGGRLAICARVAATLMLSGRSAVRIDGRPPGPDDATLPQLSGGREEDRLTAIPTKIEVDERALREALGTGVLTAAGPGRLAFAQASYAEFLTARWLAEGALSVGQRRSLLFSEGGERARVVPQLQEVASWLATLSPSFHAELMALDPMVLLRAEPINLDGTERERLVDALLAGIRSLEIERWDRRIRSHYRALGHCSLAEQLRVVICDPDDDPQTRQVACDIAKACELTELGPELADRALDSDCHLQVRIAALSALEELATPELRRRVRSLALEDVAEDEQDELKGAALNVVWPQEIDVAELLGALREPRAPNLYGHFKAFILNEVVGNLPAADLPAALRWAAKLPVTHFPTEPLPSLRDELLVAAWPQLPAGGQLADAYLEVVSGLLTGSANLISNTLREEHPEVFFDLAPRRALLEGLITRLEAGDLHMANLLFSSPRLLVAEDMDWLVVKLRGAIGTKREETLAALVERLLILGASEEALLEARQESSVLRRLTAYRYDAVRLGSPAAEEAQREYVERLELEREEEEPAEEDVDIPAGVARAMERFEAGELDGFWVATRWLEFDPEHSNRALFVSDLQALSGWSVIDEAMRRRILSAASQYLAQASPQTKEWFGKGTIYWPAWAGYRALRLLRELDPTRLDSLARKVWERWAPIIVAWPRDGTGASEESGFNDWAVAQLLSHAPETAASWLGKALDRELRLAQSPTALIRFEGAWHPALEATVLRRARRSGLDPQKRSELLRFLIAHGSLPGLQHARQLSGASAINAGGRRLELAVRVAAMLAAERGGGEWPRLWELIERSEEFGVGLIESLAADETQVVSELSAEQAGALYSWTEARYPAAEDPRVEGTHSPSLREMIGDWRGRMLNVIANQGTREAVIVLGKLGAENPEHYGIRRLKRDAEEILQRSEWEPPRPEDVLRLSDDAKRRYVRSARDLANVLLSSLERAQGLLSGQRGQAALLWNSDPLRPKRERQVASWLEGHFLADLRERGILVGRELEIRPHPEGYMGESVDITVAAVAGAEVEGSPIVSVTIELKCCWHADRDTAMREQLVKRYLDADNIQGIYLLAHFDSASWDDGEPTKRRACRKRNLENSRQFYAEQAAEVSAEGLADVSAFVLDFRPEADT
jgi:hypothetical protein